jgi:O-acetyl-ADP-ribose deacetylase (regulator of RNase III)
MITYVTGDIVLSQANAIAHGVAPNDHFEQGLALCLREQWPAMVKDFRHWCRIRQPKPGEAWLWGGTDGKRIVNLLTQEAAADVNQRHPGRAKSEYVNHALRALRKTAEKEGFTSLAISKLATGVGGLEWAEVKPLIESQLGDLKIPVYVYEGFEKGVAAPEAAIGSEL